MKDYRQSILFIASILLLFSCGKDNKGNIPVDDGSIRYQLFQLEKKGWKSKLHSQKADDIKFTATEVPIQFYLLKDKGNNDLFEIDSLYQENKKERVIEFTYEQEDEEDLLKEQFTSLSYEEGVKYMSFTLDKDFYVVTSKKDTIKCTGVSYERNFKIAPFQKVLLFFSGIDPEENIQLIYNDKLFKKGTLKFQFKDTYTEILL
jgi:hypothetical protein